MASKMVVTWSAVRKLFGSFIPLSNLPSCMQVTVSKKTYDSHVQLYTVYLWAGRGNVGVVFPNAIHCSPLAFKILPDYILVLLMN